MILLSVLIPSVPTRWWRVANLYHSLAEQAETHPVEILMLTDNKQRSIGKKREALLKISRGNYVAFVDDDDEVADDYIPQILGAITTSIADVVVFPTYCTLNGSKPIYVEHGLEYENEDVNPAGFKRKPWHVHAWRGDLVRPYDFPDANYGEDWGWVQQFVGLARTQVRISKPLYHYKWSASGTQATL